MEIRGSLPNISNAEQAKPVVDQEARNTARKFESLFLSQVVNEMIKTVDIGDFGGGSAEEKWRSFLANAVADQIAQQGTTGIAQNIERAINNYNRAISQGGE